jgi:hypothetical protein
MTWYIECCSYCDFLFNKIVVFVKSSHPKKYFYFNAVFTCDITAFMTGNSGSSAIITLYLQIVLQIVDVNTLATQLPVIMAEILQVKSQHLHVYGCYSS